MAENSTIAYLNGDFIPLENARVSVMDRGFVFGDGVYEVIPVYYHTPMRLNQHLERLTNSLAETRIDNPLSFDEWRNIIMELLNKNEGDNQSIYLQVTRGVAERDHGFPDNINPTILITCKALPPLSDEIYEQGVAAITLEDIRWMRCDIKAITLLPNVLLRQQAYEAGAFEAILFRNNLVTEGAASNVFIILDGVIITPPDSQFILPGVTRNLVLELAQENGLQCQEKNIPVEALNSADEIWLTSSTREIVPVTKLNDSLIGSGKPGKLWQHIFNLYQQYKLSFSQQEPNAFKSSVA